MGKILMGKALGAKVRSELGILGGNGIETED